MKKNILVIFIILCLFKYSNSQTLSPSVISPFGNYYNNSYASLSVTFGEPVIQTLINNNRILTQGFEQSYPEITRKSNNNTILVYPNPTIGLIKIKGFAGVNAVLYNLLGQKLIDIQLYKSEESVDLSHLRQSVYLLYFLNTNGKKIKTFKIVKL
jgi:hypothetical protein